MTGTTSFNNDKLKIHKLHQNQSVSQNHQALRVCKQFRAKPSYVKHESIEINIINKLEII